MKIVKTAENCIQIFKNGKELPPLKPILALANA